MRPHLQKTTAALTSAIVLVTSLFCACFGADGVRATEPGDVRAPASTHCHSHRPETVQQKSDSSPPTDGHAPICQHCQQLTGVAEAGGRFEAQPTSFQWNSGFLPLFWSETRLDSPAQPRATFGDLPPPSCGSTLLSLHCALVI